MASFRWFVLLSVEIILSPPFTAAKLLRVWQCPADATVVDTAMSPDEQRVAQILVAPQTGDPTATIVRVIDFQTHCQPVQVRAEPPQRPSLASALDYAAQFANDGALFVFSDGSSVHVLNSKDMQPMHRLTVPVTAHVGFVEGLSVARAAPVAAALVKPRAPPNPGEPKLTTRPEFLALFRVYDLNNGNVVSDYRLGRGFIDLSFAISPNGSYLAISVAPNNEPLSSSKLPDLLIVDARTGMIVRQFTTGIWGRLSFADEHTVYLAGDPRRPEPLSHPDERKLLVFDIERGKALKQQWVSSGVIRGIIASTYGTYFSMWAMSCVAKFKCLDQFGIWDGSLNLLGGIQNGASKIRSIKLSTTGRFLMVGPRILEFDIRPAAVDMAHPQGRH